MALLPSLVELSVGGQHHDTTLGTLLSDKNSMLAVLFGGNWNVPKTSSGRYFIDRDGTHFMHILNHLRGSLVLPDDFHSLDLLLAEAKYYQIGGLVERIVSHDRFTRPIHVVYMRAGARNAPCAPLINSFELQHLRREPDSFLAKTAQRLYEAGASHSRVLTLILGHAHDDLSRTSAAHAASFYTPATDRTAFADFDAALTIGAQFGGEISALSLLRRGRARELLLTSALGAVFHYLRTGEVSVHFCATEFRRLLEKDYTRLTENAASGDAVDTAREPKTSWMEMMNQISTHSVVDDLFVPLITDVANYFGLAEFMRLSQAAAPRLKPFMRMNSI